MKAEDARSATRKILSVASSTVCLTAVFSVLLASCTATTSDAPIQLGATSFADPSAGPAAALLADAAAERAAQNEATRAGATPEATQNATVADGEEAALPDQIAALPAARVALPAEPEATDEVAAALAPIAPPEPVAIAAKAAPERAADEKIPLPAERQKADEPASPAEAATVAAAADAPKKKSFLSSFFGSPVSAGSGGAGSSPQAQLVKQADAPAIVPLPSKSAADGGAATPKPTAAQTLALAETPDPLAAAKPLVRLDAGSKPLVALTSPTVRRSANLASLGGDETALPGVRQSALFEISRKSGLDDDSDVDLYEEHAPLVKVASAAGFARLAPNGLLKQRESVDTACLKPSLVRMLKTVEKHYGRPLVVTSGYRSPTYNRKVRGARNSMHMYCAAADVQIAGVSKWELARYVRSMQARGGVGTYCHTESVHIDVGPERDWNWRCRRSRS